MTRKPGPRVPCPSCGRTLGSYYPAIARKGWVKMIDHKRVTSEALRHHKRLHAEQCKGGEVKVA